MCLYIYSFFLCLSLHSVINAHSIPQQKEKKENAKRKENRKLREQQEKAEQEQKEKKKAEEQSKEKKLKLAASSDMKEEEEQEEEEKKDEISVANIQSMAVKSVSEAADRITEKMGEVTDQMQDEAKKTQKNAQQFWSKNKLYILGAIICFFVIIGTVVMVFQEGQDFASAFEWNFVTLSTVGYGDVTPSTHGGKVFAIFYIIFGVTFVIYFGTGMFIDVVYACFVFFVIIEIDYIFLCLFTCKLYLRNWMKRDKENLRKQ